MISVKSSKYHSNLQNISYFQQNMRYDKSSSNVDIVQVVQHYFQGEVTVRGYIRNLTIFIIDKMTGIYIC